MTFNPLGLQVNIISDKSNSRSSGISSEASENIDNYIEDIVDRKMRINAKPKVKRNMINAMKTIFNTLIDSSNSISEKDLDDRYNNINKKRLKKVLYMLGPIMGQEYEFTTNLYSSKENGKDHNPKYFLKIYEGNDKTNLSEYYSIIIKLIYEIKLHKKDMTVKNKCNFYLPKIISYGIINIDNSDNNEQFKIYLKMEYIDLNTLYSFNRLKNNHNILIKIFKELYKINKCLEKNYLFHNDLHQENVYIKLNHNLTNLEKIYILDYGESIARLDRLDEHRDIKQLFSRFLKGYNFDEIILNKKQKLSTRVSRRFDRTIRKSRESSRPMSATLKRKSINVSARPSSV